MRWLLALLLALYAPAAMAAWGTPSQLGTAVDAGAAHSLTTSTITVTQNDLIFVTGEMQANGNGNAVLCSDSAGNTYTTFSRYRTGTTGVAFVCWAIAATALSSGTVTVADTSTGGTNFTHCTMAVNSVSGNTTSSVEDSAAEGANDGAATTAPTVTSGTPGTAGDLFVVVYGSISTNANTYTEDAGHSWTNRNSKIGSTSLTMSSGYLIDAGTSTHIHAPTTGNVTYAQVVTAFKLAVSAGAARPGMLDLTGAGR
jgi:hypothetical protein